eukprot:TRINITY_DN4990_c0_g1_i2.p1 TRINITY_DN4990_c0_g1~~TRINITY_DN4990_c0_g1_i2.p1  ORF type:complete len:388 (+),score=28.41 TRINITY_DN4990_c0_g1_i2:400-1563(+)
MESDGASGPPRLGMLDRARPYLAMILLQFGYAGMNIITVVALNQGMSHYTLVVYRHIVATVIISPFAIIMERRVRPKMTFPIFIKILVLGLLEPVIDQNLYYAAMKYTSATFTSAMCNILPALTFVMAWILRLEKVNMRRAPGQAKVVGTMVTVTGAMVMTLYKGPILEMVWSRGTNHGAPKSTDLVKKDWVRGSLMITFGSFCWSCFIILQTFTLRTYPAELSLTALICLAATVEGTVVALAMERGNTAIWAIGLNVKLLASIYGGIICSGIAYFVQGVIMRLRGPVFVSSFGPLTMIIVAILGSVILAEEITLGRVLGAVIIVCGLYLVVWGKSRDHIVSSPLIDERRISAEPSPATIGLSKTSSSRFVTIDLSTPEIETNSGEH